MRGFDCRNESFVQFYSQIEDVMRGWTVEIGIFAVATVIQKLRKQGITVEMVRVVGYTVDQRMQNGRLTVETMFYGDSTVV